MRIRVIGDIHMFKDINYMETYMKDLYSFADQLEKDKIDMLVLNGDTLDAIFTKADIRFVNAMKVINYIIEKCIRNDIVFCMLKGTNTHDGKIVSIIKDIYRHEELVRCYEDITYETIDGVVFRFIPELYYPTYEEFKKDVFYTMADITFFHGTVEGVIPQIKRHKNLTSLPNSVLIRREDLIAKTRLFSAGSHIHERINIDNKIFYINSYSSSSFSDLDDEKGYMDFTINSKVDTFAYEYKLNPNSRDYVEYEFYIEDMDENTIKNKVAHILSNMYNRVVRIKLKGDNIETYKKLLIENLIKGYNIKIEVEKKVIKAEEKKTDTYYTKSDVSNIDKIKKIAKDEFSVDFDNKFIEDIVMKGPDV